MAMNNNIERANTIREGDKQSAIEYLLWHVEVDKEVCSFFGCGKQLSLMESLYGHRCQSHPPSRDLNLHIIDKVIQT